MPELRVTLPGCTQPLLTFSDSDEAALMKRAKEIYEGGAVNATYTIGLNHITFKADDSPSVEAQPPALAEQSAPPLPRQSEQPEEPSLPKQSVPTPEKPPQNSELRDLGEDTEEQPQQVDPRTDTPPTPPAPPPQATTPTPPTPSMPPDTDPVAAARQVLDMQMEHLNRTLEASTKTQEFLSEVNAKLAHERLQAFKIYQSEQDARLEQMKKTMEVQAQQRRAQATTGMEFASEIIARFLSNQMMAFIPKGRK